jgi:hypothetical protein
MKAKSQVSKTYTLEDVAGDDLKIIIDALLEYRKTNKDLVSVERITKELWDITREDALQNQLPITKLESVTDIENYLERLPMDTLLIPSEILPGVTVRAGTELVWFSVGKSGQLNISVWNDRESYDEKDKPAYSIFFNKHSAELINQVISTEEKFAFNVAIVDKGNLRSCNYYIDAKGKVSFDKQMYVEYNKNYKTVKIHKDNIEIELSWIETLCLIQFLNRPEAK